MVLAHVGGRGAFDSISEGFGSLSHVLSDRPLDRPRIRHRLQARSRLLPVGPSPIFGSLPAMLSRCAFSFITLLDRCATLVKNSRYASSTGSCHQSNTIRPCTRQPHLLHFESTKNKKPSAQLYVQTSPTSGLRFCAANPGRK